MGLLLCLVGILAGPVLHHPLFQINQSTNQSITTTIIYYLIRSDPATRQSRTLVGRFDIGSFASNDQLDRWKPSHKDENILIIYSWSVKISDYSICWMIKTFDSIRFDSPPTSGRACAPPPFLHLLFPIRSVVFVLCHFVLNQLMWWHTETWLCF